MIKSFSYFLLIFCFLSCKQKHEQIDSVYDYIAYVVKTSTAKTGPVKIEEFRISRRFVSKWVAIITKSGDSCTVTFYSSVGSWMEAGETLEYKDFPLMLGTTYTSTIKDMVATLSAEEELDRTRPSFDDINNLILISRKNDSRRFTSQDIGGLRQIFKYNKFFDKNLR